MNKEPTVGNYIDDEERELIEAIEDGAYESAKSLLTPEIRAQMQEVARNTLSQSSEKISLRIARTDLARVKAQAFREGVPYQTLIKSIIHQAVNR